MYFGFIHPHQSFISSAVALRRDDLPNMAKFKHHECPSDNTSKGQFSEMRIGSERVTEAENFQGYIRAAEFGNHVVKSRPPSQDFNDLNEQICLRNIRSHGRPLRPLPDPPPISKIASIRRWCGFASIFILIFLAKLFAR
jgi:hypothetical protein